MNKIMQYIYFKVTNIVKLPRKLKIGKYSFIYQLFIYLPIYLFIY